MTKYLVYFLVSILTLTTKAAFIPPENKNKKERPVISKRMGTEVGNGGNSIVCQKKRFFYDYYHYLTQNNYSGFQELENLNNMSPTQIVEVFVSTLYQIDQKFSNELLQSTIAISKAGFLVGKNNKKNFHNINIKKSNRLDISECKFEQIIYHNYKHDVHYFSVDFAAFAEMDSLNQALAIIHESLYFKIDYSKMSIDRHNSNISLHISEYVSFIIETYLKLTYSKNIKFKDFRKKHLSLLRKAQIV